MNDISKLTQNPGMIRAKEIAADLGICTRTWRDHFKLGKTPKATRFGIGWFWCRNEYNEWKNHGMPNLVDWEAIKLAKGIKF